MTISSFLGKTALVTGASRGIGRAIAVELSRSGVNVAAVARDRVALDELVLETDGQPGKISPYCCDVTDVLEIDDLMTRVGRVAILVNAAGWATARMPISRGDLTDWGRTLAVCLHAPMRIVRFFLPGMMASEDPSAIVQILSPAARAGRAGEAPYAAAKAGLRGFTEALREEARDSSVKVVSIYPGFVDTDFIPPNHKADRARFLAAQDVARAVLQALDTSDRCCPVEIVLEPQRDPFSRK